MDNPFPRPNLWFRAGIPHGTYEEEADVDYAYLPVQESFRSGAGTPAGRAASFLSWVILRDGLYRPAATSRPDNFLQDGAHPEPDVEVELNMAGTREELGGGLDSELAKILGTEVPESPAQRLSPYQRREKYHPAAGLWDEIGEVVTWRQRLSKRHALMWEWLPPAVWVAVTSLLLCLVWLGVPGNTVSRWLVSAGWPVPILLALGAVWVRHRAVKLRDDVPPDRSSLWRNIFRRDIEHLGGVKVLVGWPVWAWGILTATLFLTLPTPAAAVLSLAVLWSPVLWPAEPRRRLLESFQSRRPPLTLADVFHPHTVPEPAVARLHGSSSHPAAPGLPPMTPQLSRMSQPVADLPSLVHPLTEVAEFAELPRGDATPEQQVVGILLLEMWSAATGSAMPYWGARFGVWSADIIGTAAAFAYGHGELVGPASGDTPPPTRMVASWWEEEARGLRAIAIRHLGAEQASAALLTAAEIFLPNRDSHIPRMVELRTETIVYAARAAAGGKV